MRGSYQAQSLHGGFILRGLHWHCREKWPAVKFSCSRCNQVLTNPEHDCLVQACSHQVRTFACTREEQSYLRCLHATPPAGLAPKPCPLTGCYHLDHCSLSCCHLPATVGTWWHAPCIYKWKYIAFIDNARVKTSLAVLKSNCPSRSG